MKSQNVGTVQSEKSASVTFLEVIDAAGRLLLRTFSTAEAAGYKRQWDSVTGKPCAIEQREATLPSGT